MITLKKFKQLLTDDHDYLSKILNEKQRLSPPVIEYVINIYDDYLVKFLFKIDFVRKFLPKALKKVRLVYK